MEDKSMSMISCKKCGDIYDTDFQMEVDKDGDCICDRCYELLELFTCLKPDKELTRDI